MLMPATAIVAGFITLWLAVTTFDGLVTDDYYKQGLAINQTLARANAAQELGLVGQVKFSAEDVRVVLSVRQGVELPNKLLVTLAHPTRGGLDQRSLEGFNRRRVPQLEVVRGRIPTYRDRNSHQCSRSQACRLTDGMSRCGRRCLNRVSLFRVGLRPFLFF